MGALVEGRELGKSDTVSTRNLVATSIATVAGLENNTAGGDGVKRLSVKGEDLGSDGILDTIIVVNLGGSVVEGKPITVAHAFNVNIVRVGRRVPQG